MFHKYLNNLIKNNKNEIIVNDDYLKIISKQKIKKYILKAIKNKIVLFYVVTTNFNLKFLDVFWEIKKIYPNIKAEYIILK